MFTLQGFSGLKGFPGDQAVYFLEYPGIPVSTPLLLLLPLYQHFYNTCTLPVVHWNNTYNTCSLSKSNQIKSASFVNCCILTVISGPQHTLIHPTVPRQRSLLSCTNWYQKKKKKKLPVRSQLNMVTGHRCLAADACHPHTLDRNICQSNCDQVMCLKN